MTSTTTDSVTAAQRPLPRVRRRFNYYTVEKLWGLAFLLPFFIVFFIFTIIPYVTAIWLAFIEWHPREYSPFAGFRNFVYVVQAIRFQKALFNTFYYAAMVVPGTIVISLIIAILIVSTKSARMPSIFQATFYLPGVVAGMASAVMWRFMFDPDVGFLNYLISLVGLGPVNWLGMPNSAMPSLAMMQLVSANGGTIIIFCASLLGVPQPLYDAAMVDGASFWQKHWAITLPLITPAMLYVIVMSTLSALQAFATMFVLTRGGPVYSTLTIGYFIYNELMFYANASTASAGGLILMVLTMGLTIFQFRRFSRVVEA